MFNVYLIWGWFSGIQTGTVSGDQVPPIQVAPWVHIYCITRGPGSQNTGGPLGSYILYYKGTRFPLYRWPRGFIYIVLRGDQVPNIQVAPWVHIYCITRGPGSQYTGGTLVHIYCSSRGPGFQYTGDPRGSYFTTRGPGNG